MRIRDEFGRSSYMKNFWSAKAREGPTKAVDPAGLFEPSQSVTQDLPRTDLPHCRWRCDQEQRGENCDDASERGDQFRARHQITDVTRPLNSVSRVYDQGNNVPFTQTGDGVVPSGTWCVCAALMDQ